MSGRFGAFLISALFTGHVAYAAEGSAPSFYAGKQIQFVIRSEAGSSYDQYSRLLGKYFSLHLPGNPTVIPVNMPGSGGLTAANYIAVRAPRDGTVLTMVGQGLPVDQALGLNKSLQADLSKFNWIGNVNSSNQLVLTWHTSPIRTIEDARQRESNFGTSGAGSISTQVPALMNAIAGTKFKIVLGYKGPGDLLLAMERGEVDNTLFTWAAVKSLRPDYISGHLINIVTQVGLKPDKDLATVPLMRDLAKSPEDRAVMDYISKSVAVGRPVATTPDTPADRVAILRRAFDETLADPEFNREANEQNLEIVPMSGDALQGIIADLINAPPALLEQVRRKIKVSR